MSRDVGSSELVAPGEMASVDVDGLAILLCRSKDGQLFALRDECSHADVELSGGTFDAEALTVECPAHGAKFDVSSGAALRAPAFLGVEVFPVSEVGGRIYVDLD